LYLDFEREEVIAEATVGVRVALTFALRVALTKMPVRNFGYKLLL
jgi:hypothetical protein